MATATQNQRPTCLADTHAIFCGNPQEYVMGATVGAGLCFVTGITNIVAGGFIGAPLLAVSHFIDRNMEFLGSSIAARVARYAISLFTCISVGTLLSAMCGFQVTIALGGLLVLSMVTASVAFAMLALGY